jgi:hypothetical protein
VQKIKIIDKLADNALITTNIFSRRSQLNYDIIAIDYCYGIQLDLEIFIELLKESSIDYFYYRSVLDRH